MLWRVVLIWIVMLFTGIAILSYQSPLSPGEPSDTFDQQWVDTMWPLALVTKYIDRPAPVVAAAEPAAPAPAPAPHVAAPPVTPTTAPAVLPPQIEQVSSTPIHHLDLCERHGMHKVYTHGGKSWRCR